MSTTVYCRWLTPEDMKKPGLNGRARVNLLSWKR